MLINNISSLIKNNFQCDGFVGGYNLQEGLSDHRSLKPQFHPENNESNNECKVETVELVEYQHGSFFLSICVTLTEGPDGPGKPGGPLAPDVPCKHWTFQM